MINVNKKFKLFLLVALLITACTPHPDTFSKMPDLFKPYEKKTGCVIVNIPGGKAHGPVILKKDSFNKLSKRIYQYRLMVFSENPQTISADSLLHSFEDTLLKHNMKAFRYPTDSLGRVLFLPQESGECINDTYLFLRINAEPPSVAIIHMIGEMPEKELSEDIENFNFLLP